MEHIVEFYKPESGSYLALDPCPFCGCEEIVYAKYVCESGERWEVLCMGCMARINPGYAQDKTQVKGMWNRRSIK